MKVQLTHPLRQRLVQTAFEWEREFGVAPAITTALSEFDAAILVGHSPTSFGQEMQGVTAVRKGVDFHWQGVRYQVKAHRSSGKRGSKITNAGKASNYDWDRLIWVRYDELYVPQEAWQWEVDDYRREFDARPRLSPEDMRRGRRLA